MTNEEKTATPGSTLLSGFTIRGLIGH